MRFSQDIFGSITIEKQYLFHQGSNSILQIFSVKKSYCFEIWFYCKIEKRPILQNKFFITLGMCLFIQTDWSKFNPAKYFTIELERKENLLEYFASMHCKLDFTLCRICWVLATPWKCFHSKLKSTNHRFSYGWNLNYQYLKLTSFWFFHKCKDIVFSLSFLIFSTFYLWSFTHTIQATNVFRIL